MFSWKIYLRLLLINFPLLINAAVVNAAIEGATKVNFSGNVVDPPDCKLNGDKIIETSFGNIKKEDADGKKIVKQVNYNLICNGSDGNKALKMQIAGTSSFSENVLTTSISGLGIQFYNSSNSQVNSPILLNEWFNLPSPASNFKLSASPIIQAGRDPMGSDFTASATLMVLFQ